MLSIDLTGKRALVAGVADDGGFGFAIAKALAEAGASICVGTWPPAMNIFETLLRRGKIDESRRLSDGRCSSSRRSIRSTPPSTRWPTCPRTSGRTSATRTAATSRSRGSRRSLVEDFGDKPLDIVVHSLANGPEVKKPLIETSRAGYLAAVGVSAYSLVVDGAAARAAHAPGRLVRLAHLHGERARGPRLRRRHVVGEGGARERHAHARVRGGPEVRHPRQHHLRRARTRRARRARSASSRRWSTTTSENSPLPEAITAEEVGNTAAFLASPLASGITGTTVYVDKGYHAMGKTV